jgi:dTDP-glucose 4,6-dehydratase
MAPRSRFARRIHPMLTFQVAAVLISVYERLIIYVTDPPGYDQRCAVDAAKLETDLGRRAQETFETGIVTVRWYIERSDWRRPLRANLYQGERLGVSA